MYRYKKKKTFRFKKFLTAIILMILASVATIILYNMYLDIDISQELYGSTEISAERLDAKISAETEEEKTIEDIVEEVNKSVVGISKIKNAGNSVFLSNSTEELGLGSGIIVAQDGYILTNWHVAGDKYSNCYITLENGKIYNGTVKWANSDLDLAIVKISAKGLDYANLGDSDNIRVGQDVFAIGNPIGFEFQRTVTSGIISAKERTIKLEENEVAYYMEDLIQTDATINPGNSGGPLITKQGEVIGINTVKITTAEGIGFAVPINIIKPIIESFTKNGDFEEPTLGIYGFDNKAIGYLNSEVDFDSGVYVAQININGPSDKTGLKVGDIIVSIDGNNINKMTELRNYIYTIKPEEKVTLKIIRNNREMEIEVILGKIN